MSNDIVDGIIICLVAIMVVVGSIILILGGIMGVCWLGAGITLGQEYQTVGHVQLYEHSSWIKPHTWVVLETRGGVEAKTSLLDYHEFNIGECYQITTICRRGGLWGTENWYEVVEIRLSTGSANDV